MSNDLVVVSWDGHAINDGTNYVSGMSPGSEWGLPAVQAQIVSRRGYWPLVSGIVRGKKPVFLIVKITGSDVRALRDQLLRWFDPEDETPKKLVVEDVNGANDRYVYAICEICTPTIIGGAAAATSFIVHLAIDGDVRWRSTVGDTQNWLVTGTGDQEVVNNGGTADAYLKLTTKPTSGKAGGYSYKRWIPVTWTIAEAYTNYPHMIGTHDTAALVTASKAQADGDDWRVEVNGAETNRWFGDSGTSQFNQTATKTWVNLTFSPTVPLTLEAAIGSGDTITSLDFNEDITNLPSAGIVYVNTEAFVYTSKNNSDKRVLGVTRAARGTSAGAHAASATVYWIQNDIWIIYGNPTAAAPSVDDDYKPAFDLGVSTNTSWVYDEEFGEGDGLRTGAWTKDDNGNGCYTGNQGASADPWVEIGVNNSGYARFYLYNPCGILTGNFTNGEKRENDYLPDWDDHIVPRIQSSNGSSWVTEYEIPAPSVVNTWESWNRNETLTAGAVYVALFVEYYDPGNNQAYLEAADCTVTLDSSNTPTHTIGDEQGNYSLDCVIENETTEKAIAVAYTMALNDELEIDSDPRAKTVIDLSDGSVQMQALTLQGGPRKDWLTLQPGNNTLKYTETGAVGLTIKVEWIKRWY